MTLAVVNLEAPDASQLGDRLADGAHADRTFLGEGVLPRPARSGVVVSVTGERAGDQLGRATEIVPSPNGGRPAIPLIAIAVHWAARVGGPLEESGG